MALQNVVLALGELRKTPEYKGMESFENPAFHPLWQEVGMTVMRCLALAPDAATQDEIAERLDRMLKLCVGDLAKFRPHIEQAQAALVA